jgi:glycosyltransferase involved in cell wall biosynthesis
LTRQAAGPHAEPPVLAPRFSVVIPAFNEEAVLGECLASLAAQTYPGAFEVVVVDNASTDGTAALARRCGVRVVHEPQPGICFARQRGLASATGEIVVTTDADTTVPPGWLQHIDDRFHDHPDAVAVAGPCVYVGGPWWSRTWVRLLFSVVAVVAASTGRVVYVTATNLAFYRAAFGGYDTRLTQGGDELDVLRRLRRHGKIVFARRNPTFTSARRLTRGFVYTVVVSLCFHYLLGYVVNRIARRPVIRTAPAFRSAPDDPRTSTPERIER